MKRITTALLAIAVLALALPALASAGLPQTSNPLIDPGESLGGVVLGGSAKDAFKAWGKSRASCNGGPGGGSCSFTSKSAEKGFASFSVTYKTVPENASVTYVSISAGTDEDGDLNYNTKLAKFKTKSGIGLGSKGGAVKGAYPKAVLQHGDADLYMLAGKHGRETDFFLDPEGKVSTIRMTAPTK